MLHATLVGKEGAETEIPFKVGDYRGALDRRVGAWNGFGEVADASSRAFVWGAPFFLGRRVALVFDGMTTNSAIEGKGPFYALP